MNTKEFETIYKDREFSERVDRLIKRTFKSYKKYFESLNWDIEDLSQEVWARVLELDSTDLALVFKSMVCDILDIVKSVKREAKGLLYVDIDDFAITDEDEDSIESQDEILGRLVYHKKARYLTV